MRGCVGEMKNEGRGVREEGEGLGRGESGMRDETKMRGEGIL